MSMLHGLPPMRSFFLVVAGVALAGAGLTGCPEPTDVDSSGDGSTAPDTQPDMHADAIGAAPDEVERCTLPGETLAASEDDDLIIDEGGCSCVALVGVDCYAGALESIDRGRCRAGRLECMADRETVTCVGQVLPAASDECNGEDDDCDGATDEDCRAMALCQPSYVGRVGRPVLIEGRYRSSSGDVETSDAHPSTWAVRASPDGSSAMLSRGDGPRTTLTADRAGEYVVEYRVMDGTTGAQSACTSSVVITDGPLLEVELRWRAYTLVVGRVGFDFDLHMLRAPPARWRFDAATPRDAADCFWANGQACLSWDQCEACFTGEEACRAQLTQAAEDPDSHPRGGCAWSDGGAGGDEDPLLDIDDADLEGREVISILEPEELTYRIGVAVPSYRERAGVVADPIVEVRCAGRVVWQTSRGPRFERLAETNRFWEVVDVQWRDGAGCTASPLGEPDCWRICTEADAAQGRCEPPVPCLGSNVR